MESREKYYRICDAVIAAFRKAENKCCTLMIDRDYIEFMVFDHKINGDSELRTLVRCYQKDDSFMPKYYLMFDDGAHVSEGCDETKYIEVLSRYIPIKPIK